MTSETLPISPPLSTPQTANLSPHQVRLRQACDCCTAAKVKCDKRRPSCQRCLETDDLCQYSPSRRYGKRKRHGRSTREPGRSPPRPSPAGPESSLTPHGTDLAWENNDATLTATEAIPSFPFGHEQDLLLDWTTCDLPMYTNFKNTNLVPQRDPWMRSPEYLRDASRSHQRENPSLDMQALSIEQEPSITDETRSTATVSGKRVQHFKQETEHALACEARALTVLRSLEHSPTPFPPERRESFSGASSNAMVNANPPTSASSVDTMDTLLAANKAALGELTQMLECRCAENLHVALLHMTILSKVVFWYTVAVTTRYHSERVELKPTKIQFGALDLDDDDYATLHRAALCRELQTAGNVIRAFEVRSATNGVSVGNSEAGWRRLTIRAIREELDRIIHEIEGRQIRPL